MHKGAVPNQGKLRKLRRVLNYLKAKKYDRRIMGSDNLLKLETWVGALHTAHENVRWHTGGCMSCEVGIIHSKESKQKLNIKSTTESEVVSVSEYVRNKNHMMHFGGQGYTLHQKFLLEKNVINSCTGNSRHISIRYFLLGIM